MEVIRYINCCIVEFGRRLGLEPRWACRYLYLHGGLDLLDKNYQAEHLLPLDDTIDDLISYCKRHGGTLQLFFIMAQTSNSTRLNCRNAVLTRILARVFI